MRDETRIIGECAIKRLEVLLADAERDSREVIQHNDIPSTVVHFEQLRTLTRRLHDRLAQLQKHVDVLSIEILPTMFTNQNVKTITVEGVGRTTINVRWSASMLDKERGLKWLDASGNSGLIIQTVNAQTLGAWAREQTLAGKPPPQDVFKVSTSPYISITP